MKRFKKLTALLAAGAMAMVACLTAMPAMSANATGNSGGGTPTAKITLPAKHPEYKAYKVFDVEYNDDNAQTTSPFVYTAKADSEWFKELFTEKEKTATPVVNSSIFKATYLRTETKDQQTVNVYTITATANQEREAAKLLLGKVANKTPQTINASETAETVDLNGGPGYYLITTGTTPAVVAVGTTKEAIDVTTKMTTTPTLTKEITKVNSVEQTTGTTSAPACVGDTIEFKITVDIPSGFTSGNTTKEIVVHDTADTGLTITAPTNTKGQSVKIAQADNGFTYTIPEGKTQSTLELTYTAKLEGTDKNAYNNTAYLTYDSIDSVKVVNTITTNNVAPEEGDQDKNKKGPFTLTKFDGNKSETNGTLLKGAKFKVYRAATGGEAIKFTTPATDGYQVASDQSATRAVTDIIDLSAVSTATIKGLAGTVWFEEVEAPKGYNKLQDRVELNVDAERANGRIFDTKTKEQAEKTEYKSTEGGFAIANKSGELLPSTGGIGTTIFYVAGAILLLVAVVVLIVRRRMNEDN